MTLKTKGGLTKEGTGQTQGIVLIAIYMTRTTAGRLLRNGQANTPPTGRVRITGGKERPCSRLKHNDRATKTRTINEHGERGRSVIFNYAVKHSLNNNEGTIH